jgi:hypothetical protein
MGSDNKPKHYAYQAMLALIVVLAGGAGYVFGQHHAKTVTIASSALGTTCETVDRKVIADNGDVPTSGGIASVPGLPIAFFPPTGYESMSPSGEYPSAGVVTKGGIPANLDAKRFGVIDVSPVDNTIYGMTWLQRSASNMALAQAIARLYVDSLGATNVNCDASTWTGPYLPGELLSLEVTGSDGKALKSALAVVGNGTARALIFTQAAEGAAPDTNAILAVGRSMHTTRSTQ